VTRGQLPQRAGSLGLTAVGLPPRYPQSEGGGCDEVICAGGVDSTGEVMHI